ncbi:endonuclease/exonuclease/phosphatase family protein [Georgenia yuyongxinii]|uniref:Endonuclease/exonuclease/phosphatase family protein n=1 Tax=Georgenia yuyongxinii TaxID=2589797 RepID=A0A5B8C274_9MICO|nr:endonuclease/exonuclease/phosphatase family protein [Georgenia yuyongxinii]QDC24227.1 endonuclease/exonuclease/phosphatase family protein [Georgenia yuyongxinii]
MRVQAGALGALGVAAVVAAGLAVPAAAEPTARPDDRSTLRVATFNASLNRAAEGQLAADLATGADAQARAVAEIIRLTAPDVVLLNEFDDDPTGQAVRDFREKYLQAGLVAGGAAPVDYPYVYTGLAETRDDTESGDTGLGVTAPEDAAPPTVPFNTGLPSGHDLDNDGVVGSPGTPEGASDALGFGTFPGQYGMVVLSRYPIDTDRVRTFQSFLWRDMPGALLPDDPATPAAADWYAPEELDVLPLSSKSHWDVPVQVGNTTVHVLAAHPTPPSFDGPEDRNGRRNHDEIRFWADYVSGGRADDYIYDDAGRTGGLTPGARFVVTGDYNADPLDGDSVPGAIDQLLDHRRVRDPRPTSGGAVEAAATQRGANVAHRGDPARDTADFDDTAPGNLRVDYVLPSRNLPVRGAGVFWPMADEPGSELTGQFPSPSSDHRLVWVDVRVPGLR